jgi:hypothetical protein
MARAMMMIGHWRKRMQSVEFAREANQIPPPRMGIETRKVMKFTAPIRVLLPRIIFSQPKLLLFSSLLFSSLSERRNEREEDKSGRSRERGFE